MSDREEGLAERALAELGIPEGAAAPDLLRLIEGEAGVRVFLRPLPDGGFAGAYGTSQGEAFIIVNSSQAVTRQRFTLAHEYGHHYLDHKTRYDAKITWADQQDAEESSANRFAAALLMPRPAVDRWIAKHGGSIDLEAAVSLACFFGVSPEAGLIRLKTVGRLTPAKFRQLKDSLTPDEARSIRARLGLVEMADTISAAREHGRSHNPVTMENRAIDALKYELIDAEIAWEHLGHPVEAPDESENDFAIESDQGVVLAG